MAFTSRVRSQCESRSVGFADESLEMRFWIFLPFIPFQIAGAWWFGYALQDGQSWVAVAVAWGMANFGQAPISAIALTYMTDSYNEVSRSTHTNALTLLTTHLDHRRRPGLPHIHPQLTLHHLRLRNGAVG